MFKGIWGLAVSGLLAVCLPAAAAAQALPADYGSCWGNCGERDPYTGCACDSYCETRGDCCPDKNDLCYGTQAVPLCPMVDFKTNPLVWGTDLGWSYEHKGKLEFLFGDTWTPTWRPLCEPRYQPPNDDTMAIFLSTTRPSQLPLASSTAPVSCPKPPFVLNAAKSEVEPIQISFPNPLHPFHPDGLNMNALITPGAAWSTGTTAFMWVSTNFTLPCDPQGRCPGGSVCAFGSCIDPTAPQGSYDPRVRAAEIAYRPDENAPTKYRSAHTYFTNKFALPTLVTVNRFDPDVPGNNDYQRGSGSLLMFGRPGLRDPENLGRTPVYLAHQPVSELTPANDLVAWRPRYFAGLDAAGKPTWSELLNEAKPVIPSDFNYVGFSDVAYLTALKKWVMLYAGDIDIPEDGLGQLADDSEPRRGAIHVRTADHPWGPWTEPAPLLFRELTGRYMGCGDLLAPYGPGEWSLDTDGFLRGLWESTCMTSYQSCGPNNPAGGLAAGNLYAPNIIESWTHNVQGNAAYPRSAQIYFNVSTGSPYQVILATARLELPAAGPAVSYKRWVHVRAYDGSLLDNQGSAEVSHTPGAASTHFQVIWKNNQSSTANLQDQNVVYIRADNGRYLTRGGAHDLSFVSTPTSYSEWIVERRAGPGAINLDSDVIRLLAANTKGTSTERRIKVRSDGFYAYGGGGGTADLKLTWGCKIDSDDC